MKLNRLLAICCCLVFSHTSLAAHPQADLAHEYFVEMGNAVIEFVPTINSGDPTKIRNMGMRLTSLIKQGKPLGPTVFDKPFGSCFAMGNQAQALWMTLNSARNSQQDESIRINSAFDMFKSKQIDCMNAIDENE